MVKSALEQLTELKGIDKTHVAAAMSKMIPASIGDIAMVFARSPQHKHHTFGDIEWMLLPAVVSGQFCVAELQQKDNGARAPVAAVRVELLQPLIERAAAAAKAAAGAA